MRGRENAPKDAAAERPKRGKRYRLNLELDEELEASLNAQSERLGVTNAAWVRATLQTSLGRRGIAHAAKLLLDDQARKDQRALLHGGLFILSQLHPICSPDPSAALVEHVTVELHNGLLRETCDMLRMLLRHVAQGKNPGALHELDDMSKGEHEDRS